MPPATSPKPTTKKAGAPKAKGAVRAKSGCYTCRIRRKKCDERPDAEGRCETCLRLRLQCLGFGAKRPDWLRESNNVTELRDKIKTFLASQGMIKGHSGSGPRAAEQEPPTLHLATQNYSEPSQSPPSQLLVLNEDGVRQGPISNVREWHYAPPPGVPVAPGLPGGPPPNFEGHPGQPNPMLPPRTAPGYGAPPQEGFPHESYLPTLPPNNPTSLVPQWYPPPNMIQHPQAYALAHHHHLMVVPAPPPATIITPPHRRPSVPPTYASRFGESYTYTAQYSDLDDPPAQDYSFTTLSTSGALDELASHYMNTVAALQYQLADKDFLPRILQDALAQEGFARSAARILASVHVQRSRVPKMPALGDIQTHEQYNELVKLFNFAKGQFDDDDALAALNNISTFLFAGGNGDWERWLYVASRYSYDILNDRTRFIDHRDAMLNSSDKERFIIKTTFWFDVLASVTTMQKTQLYGVIDELYNPSKQSGIHAVSEEDPLSMMSIMGCENRIVWAFSEISKLDEWKRKHEKGGSLSIVELSRRADDIEQYLAPPNPKLVARTEEDVPRVLASEVFRTSAIVYLRTIVSGDHPLVQEISSAVANAVAALEQVARAEPKVKHVVVRSTVFAYYICAALTNKPIKREFILKQLEGEGEVGNCHGIVNLLQEHLPLKSKEVPWRSILQEHKMLLV
ncbi:fungal-specific transcription factor domain-containing protein [Lentinula raphanica]|uniref:Fungal-specific transcription factor domain-containing protein n=1 Tax=Lentinula raphanica TaxID=153919 RepID=A0AA38P2A3_9AGAR|nr:fungal-specific transcription factor domain-containing protein [Lentinula raphanica]KAJ3825683.1 fungal-specific transcription factor domain-containing protein [Lentinula raphanica]KAJ3834980.1 fungal-specific transcription factor domain-containing protein [Lentinula raphanica]KAJ3970447.1 fungal-specific transcription factor domain-containing protein [Lentinula raphanica]